MNSGRTRPRAAAAKRPSSATLAATFLRWYGSGAYRDAHYPTRDGVIPYRRFYALMAAARAVTAGEQLRLYYATALGVANAMASSDETRDAVDRAVAAIQADAAGEAHD